VNLNLGPDLGLDPVAVAGVLIIIIAGGYHAVTEHHVHLKIAQLVNPRIEVPQTRHDSRWHGMSHLQRAGVNGGMVIMAIALGVAWRIQPQATTVCAAIIVIAAAAALVSRAIGNKLGRRAGRRAAEKNLPED
jgi:hypothetical protein